MHELIWFSVPGAIVITLLTNIGLWPTLPPEITIALAPILGYVAHQFYRTIFEQTGGWAKTSRPVIQKLMADYKRTVPSEAFLIWEMTFYSQAISDEFREHNRRSWHYVMSFDSCALVSTIGTIVSLVARVHYSQGRFLYVLAYGAVALVFWRKARLTSRAIENQEMSILRIHATKFEAIAKAIA